MEEQIISADSHVIELPDLWEKGVPAAFRDRAPKAYFDETRNAWMVGSDAVPPQAVGALFMAGEQNKPDQVEKFRKAGFSAARPGGWDPVERMKDMAQDGVAAEILYPSLGLDAFLDWAMPQSFPAFSPCSANALRFSSGVKGGQPLLWCVVHCRLK